MLIEAGAPAPTLEEMTAYLFRQAPEGALELGNDADYRTVANAVCKQLLAQEPAQAGSNE